MSEKDKARIESFREELANLLAQYKLHEAAYTDADILSQLMWNSLSAYQLATMQMLRRHMPEEPKDG